MDHRHQLEELFHRHQALEPADQQAFLADLARQQPDRHRDLLTLLASCAEADALFETPILVRPELILDSVTQLIRDGLLAEAQVPPPLPETIAGYQIVKLLGHGGMGIVYLARHPSIVHDVALKIGRPGPHKHLFLARLTAERQALALMSHDGIARLHHAGQTEDQTPYFTMEYVEGPDLISYCRAAALDPSARLRLFLEVCDAVQHAHGRGVIHGDLKPANLLVARDGTRAKVKIVDFGVARACNEFTAHLLDQGEQPAMGSPIYMSPEQHRGVVDIRCDIFALGGVLAVLLAADSAATQPAQAQARLDGPLRAVVDKALAPEPNQRYTTVKELADDLERYLDHRPVSAVAPSTRYRLRLWVARHRARAALLAGLALSLMLAASALLVGYLRSERARAETARALADLQKTQNFYNQVFTQPQPYQLGGAIRFVDVLRGWEDDLASYAAADPLLEARVRLTLAETWLSLSQLDRAAANLERTDALRREHLGADHPQTRAVTTVRARLLRRRGEAVQAATLLDANLAWQQAHLAAADPDLLASLAAAAAVHLDLGHLDLAQHHAQSLAARLAAPDHADDMLRFDAAELLANLQAQRGDPEGASAQLLDNLAQLRAHFGDDHARVLLTQQNLANLYQQRGHYVEAEALFAQVYERRRTCLGEDHPYTLDSGHGLVLALWRRRQLDQAETLARDVNARQAAVLGADHPATLSSAATLANLTAERGDYASALPQFRALLAAHARASKQPSRAYARLSHNYGHYLAQAGQYREALTQLDRTLTLRLEMEGETGAGTLLTRVTRAQVLLASGQAAAAEHTLAELQAQLRRHQPNNRALQAEAASYRGQALLALGRKNEAIVLLKEALPLTIADDDNHRRIQQTLTQLGQ